LQWYVYVLRSVSAGRHYIGMSSDVEGRLREHNTKTGRWTSRFKPWEIIALEKFESRSDAGRRERFLKRRAGLAERRRLYGQLDGTKR